MAIPFAYSFRSIAIRRGSSAMAIGGIALVVMVFVALLSMAAGFRAAVTASGSPRNLIVLRKGAEAELQSQVSREAVRLIEELPCVARDARNAPLLTAESVVILNMAKRGGGSTNVSVRGTSEEGARVHSEVRLSEGRWFRPGTDEALVGAGLARRLEGFAVGQSFTANRVTWRITGVFEASGSALESELWIDRELLQAIFNRQDIYQSALFRAAGDPEATEKTLAGRIEADPRLRSLQVETETSYYTKQAKLMSDVITILGGMLTAIMAVGAVVGAMNTMYAAVSQRKREIGCMLAIGFSPESVWMAFIFEALLLSFLGALLGCAAALLMDGMKTGTTNWTTFSETAFEFRVTGGILLSAALLALLMGFIGGFLPALRAARMKVVEALRRA